MAKQNAKTIAKMLVGAGRASGERVIWQALWNRKAVDPSRPLLAGAGRWPSALHFDGIDVTVIVEVNSDHVVGHIAGECEVEVFQVALTP